MVLSRLTAYALATILLCGCVNSGISTGSEAEPAPKLADFSNCSFPRAHLNVTCRTDFVSVRVEPLPPDPTWICTFALRGQDLEFKVYSHPPSMRHAFSYRIDQITGPFAGAIMLASGQELRYNWTTTQPAAFVVLPNSLAPQVEVRVLIGNSTWQHEGPELQEAIHRRLWIVQDDDFGAVHEVSNHSGSYFFYGEALSPVTGKYQSWHSVEATGQDFNVTFDFHPLLHGTLSGVGTSIPSPDCLE